MPILTKEIFEEARIANEKAALSLIPIEKRCQEIVWAIQDIYGQEDEGWYFDLTDGDDIGGGSFQFDSDDFVRVIIEAENDFVCDLKEGNGIRLNSDGFPKRFLFEDFEEEVRSGKLAAEERIEKEKAKKREYAKSRKEKKQQMKDEIKEKVKSVLSPEEIKILKM